MSLQSLLLSPYLLQKICSIAIVTIFSFNVNDKNYPIAENNGRFFDKVFQNYSNTKKRAGLQNPLFFYKYFTIQNRLNILSKLAFIQQPLDHQFVPHPQRLFAFHQQQGYLPWQRQFDQHQRFPHLLLRHLFWYQY